jgi:ABC-type tungstate transport system substrate-binding protein
MCNWSIQTQLILNQNWLLFPVLISLSRTALEEQRALDIHHSFAL